MSGPHLIKVWNIKTGDFVTHLHVGDCPAVLDSYHDAAQVATILNNAMELRNWHFTANRFLPSEDLQFFSPDAQQKTASALKDPA